MFLFVFQVSPMIFTLRVQRKVNFNIIIYWNAEYYITMFFNNRIYHVSCILVDYFHQSHPCWKNEINIAFFYGPHCYALVSGSCTQCSDPFNFIKSTTIPIALTFYAWPLAIIVCSRTQFSVRKPFRRNWKKKKKKKTDKPVSSGF